MVNSDIVKRVIERSDSWVDEGKENEKMSSFSMTDNLYPYKRLFSPITVNHTVIPNRIVMAPMGNIAMCDETGRINDKMLQYFFQRAKGGVGLITTGLIPVSHKIDTSITELGDLSYFPRIDRSRTALMGWRDLSQGVHSFGSKIFIQITPGLGRVGNPQCLITQFKLPISSSFLPNYYISEIPCWRISDRKLKKIIKNAGQAAADSKAMGLDGCYLHGHEGYLLEQMTNPAFNHRKLGHFRSWENFGIDMVKEIRKRVGERYPIMYRIDLSLALEETYHDKMDKDKILKRFKGGRSAEMTLSYMEDLVKAGVDIFDVDLGCYDNWWLPHPPQTMPAGAYLSVSKFVKDYFKEKEILSNQGVEVPIVAVGKLGYPDLAEMALRDGDADMIMLGRPLLADPDWPRKAYKGEVKSIRPCIGCQEGCLNEFVEAGHPQCAVNPRTSFEHIFPEIPPKAVKKKRIAVIGAGPAGVEFSLRAEERGHIVTLFDKNSDIGGSARVGSISKYKFDMANYINYLREELKKSSVIVRLNTKVDLPTIKGGYDAIVFSNGGEEVIPKIDGIENAKYVLSNDVFTSKEKIDANEKVIVLGGGAVGAEMALYLSSEMKVKDVTLVEMLDYIMKGACTANRGHMIHLLEKNGVNILNSSKAVKVEDGKLILMRKTKNVPDPYNTWKPILPENIENPLMKVPGGKEERVEIPFDKIVIAVGTKPSDELFFKAQSENAAPEIYRIGDSFSTGKVLEAVRSAYSLAMRV